MMDLHIHVPRPRLFVWCSLAIVTSSSISAINASVTSSSSASSTSRQENKGLFRGSQHLQQQQPQHQLKLEHFNNRFLQNFGDWLLSDPSSSNTPTTEAPTSTPTTVPIITTCPTPLFTCADGGNCTSWQEDCNQCTCTSTGGSESETAICTRLGCLCRRDDADTLPQCPPPPPVCTTNPTCVFTGDQTVTGYTYDALNTDTATDTDTQDDPAGDQVTQDTESIPGPYIDTSPSFQGTQTVVAIRVLAPFCEPFCSEPPSVTQIAQDLFGGDNTDLLPSVKSIVEACSYGQLQLEPATIINGVTLDPPGIIEVTLDVNFNGMSVQNARDLVNGALTSNSDNNNRALGQDFQQYAAKWVYYMPPELLWNVNRDNTASHAYTSGDQSIYINSAHVKSTCGVVHEYFHTMRMGHATQGGRDEQEFDDTTGIMGLPMPGEESCQKCLEAPNNWIAGWYQDRHTELFLPQGSLLHMQSPSQTFQLVGLAEYNLATVDHTVVLKVGLGSPDYYVSFNRATGINQDTNADYADKVLIHTILQSNDVVNGQTFTDLRAALGEGSSFPVPGGEIVVAKIDTSVSPSIATVTLQTWERRSLPPSGQVDVFFLLEDTTGFQDDMAIFKESVGGILDEMRTLAEDIHFGMGLFRDYPVNDFDGNFSDYPYKLLTAIPADDAGTNGAELVQNAMPIVTAGGRNHTPGASQLAALRHAVTGVGDEYYGVQAGQGANFRPNAAKIILLWTSSKVEDYALDQSYPGPSYEETLAALQVRLLSEAETLLVGSNATTAEMIRVVGVSQRNDSASVEYLSKLAMDTGAVAPRGGIDCGGTGNKGEIIPGGQPLVCRSATGEGIGAAMIAVVRGAIGASRPQGICGTKLVEAEPGKCSVDFVWIDNDLERFDTANSLNQMPGGRYSVGTNPVALRVTNHHGLEGFCVGDIIVEDKELPTLVGVPDEMTAECDAIPDSPSLTATDNCISRASEPPLVYEGDSQREYADENCAYNYILTKTWFALDRYNNEAKASQRISVQDTTPPQIACDTNDISFDITRQAPVIFTPVVLDNCHSPEEIIVTIDDYICQSGSSSNAVDDGTSNFCSVLVDGSTATILNTGNIGSKIDFVVSATQPCGNLKTTKICSVNVV